MDRDELAGQLIGTWRRHNEILRFLVKGIPERGEWIFGKWLFVTHQI